jgi:hypothetical protein
MTFFNVVVISVLVTIKQSSLFWDVARPGLVVITDVTSNSSCTVEP